MCKPFSDRNRRGFTLVELLVVIGIIAILVGVLLPALSAARRQAATVKCATALREIGNAFQMYAIDNRGFYPPSQLSPPVTNHPRYGTMNTYTVNEITYPNSGVGVYWFNFLAKYVTKNKVGVESLDSNQTNEQRQRTLFWACPSWEGYFTGSSAGGGYSRVQPGYGMNGWPSFSPSYPSSAVQFPPAIENNFITGAQGTWYKQKSYTLNGAQRCLIADSRFWLAESEQPPTAGPYPPGVAPQAAFANVTYTGPNQTLLDIYRHGKMPPVIGTNIVDPKKGKIAFNILYADGHVATANTGDEAYHSMRMKFPG